MTRVFPYILFWVMVVVITPFGWLKALFEPLTWGILAATKDAMWRLLASKRDGKAITVEMEESERACQRLMNAFAERVFLWGIIAALSYTVWFK